jgi:NADH-quinone oxidoreductase subunit C
MAVNHNDLLVDKLKTKFGNAIQEVLDFRGERTIIVDPKKVQAICQFLRDDPDLRYNFVVDICAEDMLPAYPRFAVNYQLRSMPNVHDFRLRTLVEDPDKGPQTVGTVWPIATWLEMEVWDLMGISFIGNKSQRRLFLPEDWVGHPLRKDYPLGYEEVQFSFNWEAIQARKPYAARTNTTPKGLQEPQD